MKKYMTIGEMMKVLEIRPSKYNHFKMWCYRHHEKLDTQDCKWNHGYYLYNVALVREKCPYIAGGDADKVSTPEAPTEAAERLANAINTSTGQNITGYDVLDAFNRGRDYILMRRQMARTLWRMRKERRMCIYYTNFCEVNRNRVVEYATICTNHTISSGRNVDLCKVNAKRAEESAETASSAAKFASLFVGGAFSALIIISIIRDLIS